MKFLGKRQKQVESQTNSSPKVPRHANSDGSGHSKRRAVLFSPQDKDVDIRESTFVFKANKKELANDGRDAEKYGLTLGLRRATVFTGVLIALAGALYMNSSTIITQLVMHTDGRVLATAMDVSPDAVAFALNQLQPGE